MSQIFESMTCDMMKFSSKVTWKKHITLETFRNLQKPQKRILQILHISFHGVSMVPPQKKGRYRSILAHLTQWAAVFKGTRNNHLLLRPGSKGRYITSTVEPSESECHLPLSELLEVAAVGMGGKAVDQFTLGFFVGGFCWGWKNLPSFFWDFY